MFCYNVCGCDWVVGVVVAAVKVRRAAGRLLETTHTTIQDNMRWPDRGFSSKWTNGLTKTKTNSLQQTDLLCSVETKMCSHRAKTNEPPNRGAIGRLKYELPLAREHYVFVASRSFSTATSHPPPPSHRPAVRSSHPPHTMSLNPHECVCASAQFYQADDNTMYFPQMYRSANFSGTT